MQDRAQDPKTTPVLFWPGDQALAACLATWLDCAPPLPATDHTAKSAIVLWHGPDRALTACLTDGSGVQNALNDWKAAARGLLAHARQNRRTLILVNADTLPRDNGAALAQRLDRSAPPDLPARPALPLAQALARLALQQDTDLRALLDDLTSASLPGPEAVANSDLMEQVAAGVASQLQTLADLTQDRDHASAQLAALHVSTTQQQQADQTRAAAAAQSAAQTEADLQNRLTAQHQDLTALRATADSQTAELDLLRTQLSLGDTAMSTQLAMGDTRDSAAILRVRTLENQLAIAAADTGVHLTQIAQLTAALTSAGDQTVDARSEITRLQALQGNLDADLTLLRTQLGLAQDSTATSLTSAQTAADLAILQSRSQGASADARVQALELALAARDADLTLLRTQLGLAQDSTATSLTSAQLLNEATRLRADTQIAGQEQAVATASAENSLLRGQLTLSHDAAASSLAQAHGRDAARLDALLADHAAEVSVLTTQIALLDADLIRLLTAPPAVALANIAADNADPAYWDKALARALTSARHEAEQRTHLEQDLAALRALGQSQIRRAEDKDHNRTLFAQMTKEATASLDEIARLSATVSALRDSQDL